MHDKIYVFCDNKCRLQVNKIDDILLPASGWSSTVPYTQTIAVEDMLKVYYPDVDLLITDDMAVDTVNAMIKNFYVDRVVTNDGSCTFYCYKKKPTVDLRVKCKVV